MNNTYLKRTVCTALAGLMLALTACGNVTSDAPVTSESKPAASDNSAVSEPDETDDITDIPDITEPDEPDEPIDDTSSEAPSKREVPAANISVEPLSVKELEKSEEKPSDDFLDSYRSYAAELFKASCTDDIKAGKNVMVSPESVMMALGMTANGAKDDTLEQMEKALGGQGIDVINNAMQYRMSKFTDSRFVKFNVANSVWVRDDSDVIQMKQEFCDKVKTTYGADSFLAPFDASTKDDINNWVKTNTYDMIPSIIDDIPDDAVAYLINAIAFEGEWAEQYKDFQIREDDTFTNSKGEEESATMLYSGESNYLEDNNTTGFIKSYKGGEYAFMAMLPSEGTDIADYVASMDGKKLKKLWNSRGGKVTACIPEFKYDYGNELSDELADMGMIVPFTGDADFTEMADTHDPLYISRVIHKTHIELDRNGTKAAAATAVEMKCESAMIDDEKPKEVYLNRPFVYAIIDTESGTPIFIGAVTTVEGK